MEEDIERSAQAGFDDHIVKPLNMAQLEASIRRVTVESRGARGAATATVALMSLQPQGRHNEITDSRFPNARAARAASERHRGVTSEHVRAGEGGATHVVPPFHPFPISARARGAGDTTAETVVRTMNSSAWLMLALSLATAYIAADALSAWWQGRTFRRERRTGAESMSSADNPRR